MIHDLRVGLEEAALADPEEPLRTAEECAAGATLCETAKAMHKVFIEKFGNGSGIVRFTEVRSQTMFFSHFVSATYHGSMPCPLRLGNSFKADSFHPLKIMSS